MGWIAEQWSCSRPGMIASLLRVPPPISSAASSTVTWTPALARATAAARPFGPDPTTTAVVIPRLPLAPVLSRSSLRSSLALGFGPSCQGAVIVTRGLLAGQRPGDLGRDRAVGQPGLLGDGVGHLPRAALDHTERPVDDLVVLNLAAPSLRLHPDDDEFARLERRLALNRGDHVRVVQVAVAEVEPDQRVADELTFADASCVDVRQVREQHREQATTLAVHGAPGDHPLHRDVGPLRLVPEVDELVDLVLGAAGHLVE